MCPVFQQTNADLSQAVRCNPLILPHIAQEIYLFHSKDASYVSNFRCIQDTGTRGNMKENHVRDGFITKFTSQQRTILRQYEKVR